MNYTFEFSPESMKELEKLLKTKQKKFNNIGYKIIDAYADYFMERAKEYVPIDTGELKNSITKSQVEKLAIEVFTDCGYAKYVEFGTGIAGERSKHPEYNEEGWEYDIHKHGDIGWYYPKEDKIYWTKGQPASEFWYKAYQDLDANKNQIAEEVLRKEGLI